MLSLGARLTRRVRRPACFAAAGALLLLAGCASGGAEGSGPGAPPAEPVTIKVTVNNNLTPRTQVTVRLQSGGVTRILGGASPGRERTFDVEGPTLSGTHLLTATGDAGVTIVSQPFSLFANSWITWRLQGNVLQVGRELGKEQ